MGAKVISSLAEAYGRGIYISFVKAIKAVRGLGTGRSVIVGQFPWGPLNTITDFDTPGEFRRKFAPDGTDRTGSGYNCVVNFPWTDLRIVRVLGATPVRATINMQKTGPANCVAVTALYYGATGNSIVCTVADASNAVANSFDLTITLTNSTTGKSTVEVYRNVDSTQTGAAYWTNLTQGSNPNPSRLVDGLVKSASGRPVNGNYALASGSDGSAIVSGDYLGTPGSADKGVALLESDPNVNFFFCDEVPSGILSTVNTGIKAHAVLMNDRRIGIVTGAAGESAATAKTNAAALASATTAYVFPHGKVRDEDAVSDTATKITIPLPAALAALASLMQPHLSPAYKNKDFTKALSNILELDVSNTSASALDSLERAGVIAFEANSDGVFSPYDSIMSDGATYLWEQRMKRWIPFSIATALEEYRNGPNDTETQEDERTIVGSFLAQLVGNKQRDHIFLPSISDGGLLPSDATNSAADIAAGDYTIGYQATLIAEQKRIILSGELSSSTMVTESVTPA